MTSVKKKVKSLATSFHGSHGLPNRERAHVDRWAGTLNGASAGCAVAGPDDSGSGHETYECGSVEVGSVGDDACGAVGKMGWQSLGELGRVGEVVDVDLRSVGE